MVAVLRPFCAAARQIGVVFRSLSYHQRSSGLPGFWLSVMPFTSGGVPVAITACDGHVNVGARPATSALIPFAAILRRFAILICSRSASLKKRESRPSIEMTINFRLRAAGGGAAFGGSFFGGAAI